MILCCGEALIDMIPAETRGDRPAFQPHAGGAIFNTAIGLGRLGVSTGFLSGLSTDLFGVQLRDALTASNVDAGFSITSDRPTTLAFVELSDGQATYTFYDEGTAGRSLSADLLPSLPEKTIACYFGGISLISEPCAEFYRALAQRASANHVVVLDPNIRTGFIHDEMRYRTRLNTMIAAADLVKVSDEDLDWMIPEELALEAKVSRISSGKVVIVTRGSAGSTAFLPNGQTVDAPAQQVDVVDTVGAGDTFNAGVLASLDEQGMLSKPALAQISAEQMALALTYGASVAAVTVSRAGANPPWRSEIE
ncbi:MAG: carbohydrate kinase [Pseudomonadota bacterium]